MEVETELEMEKLAIRYLEISKGYRNMADRFGEKGMHILAEKYDGISNAWISAAEMARGR